MSFAYLAFIPPRENTKTPKEKAVFRTFLLSMLGSSPASWSFYALTPRHIMPLFSSYLKYHSTSFIELFSSYF